MLFLAVAVTCTSQGFVAGCSWAANFADKRVTRTLASDHRSHLIGL